MTAPLDVFDWRDGPILKAYANVDALFTAIVVHSSKQTNSKGAFQLTHFGLDSGQ